ncbi:MAG: hypothetical protein ABL931_24260 [Usitatibacteraceae bacterium]
MQAIPSRINLRAATRAFTLGVLLATSAFAQVRSTLPAPPIRDSSLLKAPSANERVQVGLAEGVSMSVKQIETTVGEFPQMTANQYKLAFECRIAPSKPQTDFSKFPRYSCFLDQPRTRAVSDLSIRRVDYFPSVDGIATKIVMVVDNSGRKPNPERIRTAFQLIHEKNEVTRSAVLKDFVYVDGLPISK